MLQYFRMSFVATVLFVSSLLPAESAEERAMEHPTFYRSIRVDGLSIFYREAGPKDAPTLLLLHGLPSSSRMFEPLFARLSDRYHLVAPDYPGCRQECGWNYRSAGSENLNIACQAARSIG